MDSLSMINTQDKINKSLKINRVLLILNLIIVSVLTVCVVAVGFKAYKLSNTLKPAYKAISDIDYSKFDDIAQVVDEISQIDFEGIGQSIESIDFEAIAELVDTIDVNELKRVMENVKTASDILETVNKEVAPILEWFHN